MHNLHKKGPTQRPGIYDVRNVYRAFGYSLKGVMATWHNEAAFRQEVVLCIIFIPLAIWLGSNNIERALLIGTTLLVPLVEIINSAIETVVNRFGGAQNKLSGQAKDMASAAVLFALLIWFCVWGLIIFGA